MFKNALVTVSDKTGLADFIKPLVEQGMRVVSTGGTARYLKSHKIPIIEVSEQTQFPEVLSGRVKTLHPFVHMPILARQNVPEDQAILKKYNLDPFDLVVCNLYPFSQNSHLEEDEEMVEWIDVGGPSLLRAAAKNFFKITAICHPEDYKEVQSENTSLKHRKKLASKVFRHLSCYDALIAQRLGEVQSFSIQGEFFKKLRYGENPHQKGDWYKDSVHSKGGIHEAQVLQGKELSFNNLLDLETAVLTLKEFKEACCVCVKHNNPCGVACGTTGIEVLQEAIKADPVSVFGGIIAINQKVDGDMAKKMTEIFLECIIAPDYTEQSLEILSQKKNLRVLKWPQFHQSTSFLKWKQITGGILVQNQDQIDTVWNEEWKIIGSKPSQAVKKDLLFAWIICAHLKSNAIATVRNKKTLGLGMGQINRVDAVELALSRAKKFHPQVQDGIILASDAFFPFSDSVEVAAQKGVKWIMQPGGSIKDEEIIQKTQDLGVNMVLTGKRHFHH